MFLRIQQILTFLFIFVVDILSFSCSKTFTDVQASNGFSYRKSFPDEPLHWPGMCSTGRMQSPINIDINLAIKISMKNSLNFTGGFNSSPKSVKLVNNGHGVTFTFTYKDPNVPQISGGSLGNEIYNFESFHIHWPCEHTIAFNFSCALEVHLVHFNTKYGTMEKSLDKSDGVAVISLIFWSLDAATHLPFISLIKNVKSYKAEYVEADPMKIFKYSNIADFVKESPAFLSYKGSLTTPPCGKLH